MVSGERASETKQDDASTRLEGAEINKSLLALKECAYTALHGHWPEAAFLNCGGAYRRHSGAGFGGEPHAVPAVGADAGAHDRLQAFFLAWVRSSHRWHMAWSVETAANLHAHRAHADS